MSVQTSGYLPWLADAAHATGLPVVEVSGWRTRGHDGYVDVRGVIAHDTGTGVYVPGNYPSLNAIVNGRGTPGTADYLSGPLASYGLGRDGTVYVIAAGVCWHAGTGVYSWIPRNEGNWYAVGIEAESSGVTDDWTPAQREAYPRLVAAILTALGLPSTRLIGHKEYSDAGKVDPSFWDMNTFRAQVAELMGHEMDVNTPIAYPADAPGYFDSTAPGLGMGQAIAQNFPVGKTAPLGMTLAYTAMRACTAELLASHCLAQLGVVSKQLNDLTAAVKTLQPTSQALAEIGYVPPPPGVPHPGTSV